MATFESLIVLLFSVGSTVFFNFYEYDGLPLAAKLDFTLLGKKYLFFK